MLWYAVKVDGYTYMDVQLALFFSLFAYIRKYYKIRDPVT